MSGARRRRAAELRRLTCGLAFWLTAAFLARPTAGQPAEVVEVHFAMWTPVLVAVVADDDAIARRAIGAAMEEIHRLERLHSTFDEQSEASRLNAAAGAGWAPPSPELAADLRLAKSLGEQSDGMFSVLVGPLVDRWRGAAADHHWPGARELLEAARLSAPGGLEIDGLRARLADARMKIELGGFAKGVAADRALHALQLPGVSTALVNLGGSSMAAFGSGPRGDGGWPVDAPPGTVMGDGSCVQPIVLRDEGLSTSHSFGKRTVVGGTVVGHIIDPRSGLPLRQDRYAIARHRSAAVAEALSKILLVSEAAGEGESMRSTRIENLGGQGVVLFPAGPTPAAECLARPGARTTASSTGRAT